MTPTQQFIIDLLKEGRGYLKALPAFIASVGTFLIGWHIKQPNWIQKKPEGDK